LGATFARCSYSTRWGNGCRFSSSNSHGGIDAYSNKTICSSGHFSLCLDDLICDDRRGPGEVAAPDCP
jgi:hypothetical protein